MPVIRIYHWDKKIKKPCSISYNTDKAEFVCNVPEGRLLKKKKKFNFYIYNPRGKTKKEQIREVPYLEAKELIRKWGTREQFCKYFTIMNADGTYKQGNTHVVIDQVHMAKLKRTASMLSLSMKDTLAYLIDKYDDMANYNRSFTSHKKGYRVTPADITDLTS